MEIVHENVRTFELIYEIRYAKGIQMRFQKYFDPIAIVLP